MEVGLGVFRETEFTVILYEFLVFPLPPRKSKLCAVQLEGNIDFPSNMHSKSTYSSDKTHQFKQTQFQEY